MRSERLEIPYARDVRTIASAVRQAADPGFPLRWAVVGTRRDRLEVEATVWEGAPAPAWDAGPPAAAMRPHLSAASEFVVAQILPTGIGLATGGFAGDGTPATNLLARAADRVVTHPNAVNAAGLNWAEPNVLYVEGAMLDAWLAGDIALRPVRANKVGVLVDRGIEAGGALTLVENAVGAFRAVGGGAAIMAMTDEPLDLQLTTGASGASAGSVANPGTLVDGARQLVARGAEAIAIVGDFRSLVPDIGDRALHGDAGASDDPYLAGRGVDPIGGLEAVVSHIVWHALGVPCAHAPFLWPSALACDPRAAAEELGGTFLVCVLRGLRRAPRPAAPGEAQPGDLLAPDLVIVPEGAAGGQGTLAAAARGLPLLAVHNPSVLSVRCLDLGLEALAARSYPEAAGLVLALAAGLDPAELMDRPIP